MVFDYPLNMTRKQALIRRADKLIGWLQSDRYSYTDEESVVHLRKLISLLIEVLDYVLKTEDGRVFLRMFQDARKILDIEEGEDMETAYNDTKNDLITTLETYRGYVEDTIK